MFYRHGCDSKSGQLPDTYARNTRSKSYCQDSIRPESAEHRGLAMELRCFRFFLEEKIPLLSGVSKGLQADALTNTTDWAITVAIRKFNNLAIALNIDKGEI